MAEHVTHSMGTRGGVLSQSLERSERVGVDRFPVHLHDRDVTVDVLSSGAAENVRTSATCTYTATVPALDGALNTSDTTLNQPNGYGTWGTCLNSPSA